VRLTLKSGIVQQDYRQAGLIDILEPTWEGRLEWLVTPLVTLTLAAQRDVRATSYGSASGQLLTSYSLKADYELWRNLIVTAHGAWREATYLGATREDTVLVGGIALEYMHTKNWLTTLSYEHQQLTSTDADYSRSLDKVGVSVKYRF
jgi:hypothetical protein